MGYALFPQVPRSTPADVHNAAAAQHSTEVSAANSDWELDSVHPTANCVDIHDAVKFVLSQR
jgi:hypothetical protein